MQAIVIKVTGSKIDLNDFIAFLDKYYLVLTKTRLLSSPEKSESEVFHVYLTVTGRTHALQRDYQR